jgi:hypothetical protein
LLSIPSTGFAGVAGFAAVWGAIRVDLDEYPIRRTEKVQAVGDNRCQNNCALDDDRATAAKRSPSEEGA